MSEYDGVVSGSVMVCLPQYAGMCHTINMQSVCRLVQAFERGGYPYELQFGSDSAVHRVRYMMTEAFMRSEFEYLLWIDGDIEFEPDAVGRLLEMARGGADVAVGLYRLKKEGAMLAAHTGGQMVLDGELPTGAFDVDYAGTGFMLIHRGVFEAIAAELPEIDTDRYGKIRRWWSFDVTDGVELPEDYGFCERAKRAGKRVVADAGIKLKHWGWKGY